MPLSELLAGTGAVLPRGFDPLVRGLSLDSRQLAGGDVFVALAGAATHGLRHLAQAEAAQVAAVLYETPAPDGVVLPAHAIAVDGLHHALGALADRFYAAPSRAMTTTGVTGTNGKTPPCSCSRKR